MAGWDLLPKLVLLLAGAAAAGLLAFRLGQNVVVGYIVAGFFLGPSGLGVVRNIEEVELLSEIGVALLLFSIGLEFSLKRLKSLGRIALIGGTLQIAVTFAAVWMAVTATGLAGPREATAIGLAISLSSTAVVLRILTDRAELDSVHGRNSIGILLLQDVAVVPILIAMDALGKAVAAELVLRELALRAALMIGFALALWLLARFALPYAFTRAALSGSRDLPVLITVCTSVGAMWGAHALEFSPALGAFMAGLLLAETPFATQIRADTTPLAAAFVALFFTSIGALTQVPRDLFYLVNVLAAAFAIIVLKFVVAFGVVWLIQRSLRSAVLTGLCLAQAGEFSFVLLQAAGGTGVISPQAFQVVLTSSLLTLALTPYVIAMGPALATGILRRLPVSARAQVESHRRHEAERRVLVVGFGPAGQQVVLRLADSRIPFSVLEMNPRTVAQYRSEFPIEMGDATRREVLQHMRVGRALALVVTLPDPAASRVVIEVASKLSPNMPIIVRSRYDMYADGLKNAGADLVINEERLIGTRLAAETLHVLTGVVAGASELQ